MIASYAYFVKISLLDGWKEGRKDGWMDGRVGAKAGLRIAAIKNKYFLFLFGVLT